MAGYSELIKNFSKTRDYVRDFFIYGFKVRGDFSAKSSRTYDDERRRVEGWLGDLLRYDDTVRGRKHSISLDSGHITENPLYKAYYSKSFTDNDIRLHFCILDLLTDSDELTLREITDGLLSEYGFLFEDQTVRNKLREYVSEGLISAEKRGKTAVYRISAPYAEDFVRSFNGLDDALRFFSGCEEFGVIGDCIMHSAGLKNDVFLMKHNYIVHTLEDEMLPQIIECFRSGSQLKLDVCSANSTERTLTAVPMQLLSSPQTGRRYIAAYIRELGWFSCIRLDRIIKAYSPEKCTDVSLICKRYNEVHGMVFGVSFGSPRSTNVHERLKIVIAADEEHEPYIIARLMREKRCGTVEKIAPNRFLLTFDLLDPNEVMGWLKTFIGRIVSIEGGDTKLRERFNDDIRRMHEMYGGAEKWRYSVN